MDEKCENCKYFNIKGCHYSEPILKVSLVSISYEHTDCLPHKLLSSKETYYYEIRWPFVEKTDICGKYEFNIEKE